jgi:hypothetical protein
VVNKLDSQTLGRGFYSHTILDGNGFKAMPGSIVVKSSNENNENIGGQMGHTKKYF